MAATAEQKRFFDNIRKQIEEALKPVSEYTNLKIETGSITFDSINDFKLTLKFSPINKDILKKKWDSNCWRFGLSPDDFGKQFTYKGKIYIITDCDYTKYPVLTDTKTKFKGELVKSLLKK